MDKKAIYVADTGNDVIRKIDINSLETSTIAGTGEEGDKDGPALQAQFNNPGAICTDGSFLYILDADNHSIRKMDLNANTVTKLTLVNGHIGSGCALTSDGKQLYFQTRPKTRSRSSIRPAAISPRSIRRGSKASRDRHRVLIDLRSDTVTLPTPEMREAIARAELGDDVYGEDPSVNRLEAMAASMMGKDAALLVPSGTMGNLAAMLTHCARGTKAIVGSQSHTNLYEAGGASALGGIVLTAIANTEDGELDTR